MGSSHQFTICNQSQVGAAVRQALHRHERAVTATLAGTLLFAISPPSLGLTLGPLGVRSALGQRLVATVPVRLGEGETLLPGCVEAGNGPSGLGRLKQASVAPLPAGPPGDYSLEIRTATPLYEPMYELEIRVDCPGVPAVVRQYVLMLDLPGSNAAAGYAPSPMAAQTVPVPPAAEGTLGTADPTLRPQERRSRASGAGAPIDLGSRYQVRQGDTLSSIAARVRNRPDSLWVFAGQIFAANPEAFIRGDANLIRLGAEITIPAAANATPGPATTATIEAPSPVPAASPGLPTIAAPPPVAPVAETAASNPSTVAAAEPAPAATQATSAAAPPKATRRKQAQQTPAKLEQRDPASAGGTPVADDKASPLAAILAGVAFGLLVSGLLWLSRNLPTLKPWRANRKKAPPAQPAPVDEMPRAAPAPLRVLAQRPVPAFTVSFSQAEDDPLAGEYAEQATASPLENLPAAGDEITSELEKIFGATDTGLQRAMDGKTIAAKAIPAEPRARIPAPAREVDLLLGDESATINSPTLAPPDSSEEGDRASASGTIDIQSLAKSAGHSQGQARDLMDALTLLERDYEEELTASQVLDLSAMREALAAGEQPEPMLRKKSG
jgi:hypothetical protein